MDRFHFLKQLWMGGADGIFSTQIIKQRSLTSELL
jgi:hypothetical protein